jgi:hypothetical protein
LSIIIVPAKYVCTLPSAKLFDNQKIYVIGATSLFYYPTLTASIIDIVPSAVNQEKATGELTCNLNFILIVAPVKSKLKMFIFKSITFIVGKLSYYYFIFSCNY